MSLEQLPPEMLCEVASHLSTANFLRFRRTCKAVQLATTNPFGTRFFTSLATSLQPAQIEPLAQILQSSSHGLKVKKLKLLDGVTYNNNFAFADKSFWENDRPDILDTVCGKIQKVESMHLEGKFLVTNGIRQPTFAGFHVLMDKFTTTPGRFLSELRLTQIVLDYKPFLRFLTAYAGPLERITLETIVLQNGSWENVLKHVLKYMNLQQMQLSHLEPGADEKRFVDCGTPRNCRVKGEDVRGYQYYSVIPNAVTMVGQKAVEQGFLEIFGIQRAVNGRHRAVEGLVTGV